MLVVQGLSCVHAQLLLISTGWTEETARWLPHPLGEGGMTTIDQVILKQMFKLPFWCSIRCDTILIINFSLTVNLYPENKMYNGAICRDTCLHPQFINIAFYSRKNHLFLFFLINRIQTLSCINNESSVDIANMCRFKAQLNVVIQNASLLKHVRISIASMAHSHTEKWNRLEMHECIQFSPWSRCLLYELKNNYMNTTFQCCPSLPYSLSWMLGNISKTKWDHKLLQEWMRRRTCFHKSSTSDLHQWLYCANHWLTIWVSFLEKLVGN